MHLINLTPHPINIVYDAGVLTIDPSGTVARSTQSVEVVGSIVNSDVYIPLTSTVYGDVQDLPDPCDNTLYIVSTLIRLACPNRNDLVSPGELVRDSDGKVVGCKSLNI